MYILDVRKIIRVNSTATENKVGTLMVVYKGWNKQSSKQHFLYNDGSTSELFQNTMVWDIKSKLKKDISYH